mmetsp:Transcript_33371/g.76174  ORF Transcript_33371/g.76174 Transcript_33371/m.76174 type:complete len:497 (-) Transcript_33371:144-1634(-)
MGAGASTATESRIFCHQCGSRSRWEASDAPLTCEVCGATKDVEVTDCRLPVAAAAMGSGGERSIGATALLAAEAEGGSSSSSNSCGSMTAAAMRGGDLGGQGVNHGLSSSSTRVESLTVVTTTRPEDGAVVLRVVPNFSPPQESQGVHRTRARDGDVSDQQSAGDTEEGHASPEPACAALVARLEARDMTEKEVGKSKELCVICAEELQCGEKVISLACSHVFHEQCIHQWLARQHTCPTCRLELEVNDVKYLRSIGLDDEADALEKIERERQEKQQQKQAAERRRWLASMRRGDPVHFGLTCSNCHESPLTGECYRCLFCDWYTLCSDCFNAREARLARRRQSDALSVSSSLLGADIAEDIAQALDSRGSFSSNDTGASSSSYPSVDDHPDDHIFEPFGVSGASSVGPRGMVAVLMPNPSVSTDADPTDLDAVNDLETPRTVAEVAYAAVRSLAFAPLSSAPSRGDSSGTTEGSAQHRHGGRTGSLSPGRSHRRW